MRKSKKENAGHPWKYGLDYMEERLDSLLKDMERLSNEEVHLYDYIDELKEKNVECPMVDIRHYYLKGRTHDERKWPMLPFKLWLKFKWGVAEFEVYTPDIEAGRTVQLSWWNIYKGNRGKGIKKYQF